MACRQSTRPSPARVAISRIEKAWLREASASQGQIVALRMGRFEGRHCCFGACVKYNLKALQLPRGTCRFSCFCSLIGFSVLLTMRFSSSRRRVQCVTWVVGLQYKLYACIRDRYATSEVCLLCTVCMCLWN